MAALSILQDSSARGPSFHYREKKGASTLSRTYESSHVLTPFQGRRRITISDDAYQNYRSNSKSEPRTPMGMEREYGGLGNLNLPKKFQQTDPPRVAKGHQHFGSGIYPFPRGEPIEQFYTLTQLKKSNVRVNDELVPKPQSINIGRLLIDKPFPAEHPYSSHMSRYDVFPKFDSPEDPTRGWAARQKKPISADTPASAYDVEIKSKIKGFGIRHELQQLPTEGQKKGLHWLGDDFYQPVKVHGGKAEYYPIPPKSVVPNLHDRGPGLTVSQRTANALRNVEREQWQTTYQQQHTGLGTANPMALDNQAEKVSKWDSVGIKDDNLYPNSINTFDPPRPLQGRGAKQIFKPAPFQSTSAQAEDKSSERKMTLTEREEDRLLHGKKYPNFPNPQQPDVNGTLKHENEQWKTMNYKFHADPNLEQLEEAKQNTERTEVPYHPAGPPVEVEKPGSYLDKLNDKHQKTIQQVEAQNRYQELESMKPNHDVTQWNHKAEKMEKKTEHPSSFYLHEGKYNAERAGLYQTKSYKPEVLEYQMNKEELSGNHLMNHRDSHIGALHLTTPMNQEIDEAFVNVKTDTTNGPMFSDRPDARDVIEPYQFNVEMQRRHLHPNQDTADVRVQEKHLYQKESKTGNDFNTPTFLQENVLPPNARQEPVQVMSNENQQLSNVRPYAMKREKSVSFTNNITVATGAGGEPITLKSAPMDNPKYEMDYERNDEWTPPKSQVITTQYQSSQAQYKLVNEQPVSMTTIQPVSMAAAPQPSTTQAMFETTAPPMLAATGRLHTDLPIRDQFRSNASNVAPANIQNTFAYKTSYEQQFPTVDLSYKNDDRFDWKVGSGVPRPQTTLLRIQNSFSKTGARRKFHSQFKEHNPDLKMNVFRIPLKGKQHNFGHMNAQMLHGHGG